MYMIMHPHKSDGRFRSSREPKPGTSLRTFTVRHFRAFWDPAPVLTSRAPSRSGAFQVLGQLAAYVQSTEIIDVHVESA